MQLLEGKVAIVTGGTRGIGYATVEKFLQNGAKVALCGSRQETVDNALSFIKKRIPEASVMGFMPDLLDESSVQACFKQVYDQWGRIDILVNNAGVSARERLYDYDVDEFENTMDINLNAVFICAKTAARQMRRQGSGVILNTSSLVSIYGQSSGSAYPASKFAVNGLTKSLARELGKDHIRVNAVAPGIIRTDMVRALPEEIIQPLANSIPLGRVGEPEDIANAFLFLASDMASYVTGEVLSVDGAAMT